MPVLMAFRTGVRLPSPPPVANQRVTFRNHLSYTSAYTSGELNGLQVRLGSAPVGHITKRSSDGIALPSIQDHGHRNEFPAVAARLEVRLPHSDECSLARAKTGIQANDQASIHGIVFNEQVAFKTLADLGDHWNHEIRGVLDRGLETDFSHGGLDRHSL